MNILFRILVKKSPILILIYYWIKIEYFKFYSEKENIKKLYDSEKYKDVSTDLLIKIIKMNPNILLHLIKQANIYTHRDISVFFSYLVWNNAWNPLSVKLIKLIEYKTAKKFVNKFGTPRTYFIKPVKRLYRNSIYELCVSGINYLWNFSLNSKFKFSQFKDMKVYYSPPCGDKPTILIFHDIGINLSKWAPLLTDLSFKGYGFILPEIPGISLTYYNKIKNKKDIFETIYNITTVKIYANKLYILGDAFGTIIMTQFLNSYYNLIKPKKLFYVQPLCFLNNYANWNNINDSYILTNLTWIHYYLNTMKSDNSISELFDPKNTWIFDNNYDTTYNILSYKLNIIQYNNNLSKEIQKLL